MQRLGGELRGFRNAIAWSCKFLGGAVYVFLGSYWTTKFTFVDWGWKISNIRQLNAGSLIVDHSVEMQVCRCRGTFQWCNFGICVFHFRTLREPYFNFRDLLKYNGRGNLFHIAVVLRKYLSLYGECLKPFNHCSFPNTLLQKFFLWWHSFMLYICSDRNLSMWQIMLKSFFLPRDTNIKLTFAW